MSLPIGSLVESNPNARPERHSHYHMYSRGLVLGKIENTSYTYARELLYEVRVLKTKRTSGVAIRTGVSYWMLASDLLPYRSKKKCTVKVAIN